MRSHEELCCLKKKNKCQKCGVYCEHPNYEEVGWLIDTIECYIVSVCEKKYEYKQNGYVYGLCDYDPKDEGNEVSCLISYRKILKKIWNLLYLGSDHCMCLTHWDCLKDKVLKIVGKVKMDASSQEVIKLDNDWLLNNPGMTTFERWEKSLYAVAPVLEFCTKVIEEKDKEFLFEVIKHDKKSKEFVFETFKKVEKALNIEVVTKKKDGDIDLHVSTKKIVSDIDLTFDVRQIDDSKELKVDVLKHREVAEKISVTALKKIRKKNIITIGKKK